MIIQELSKERGYCHTKVSVWKCSERGRILRAASLAEIGGVGFFMFEWVDWTFYFICTVLLTLMGLNRGKTHVLIAKAHIMQTVGLLCGYG